MTPIEIGGQKIAGDLHLSTDPTEEGRVCGTEPTISSQRFASIASEIKNMWQERYILRDQLQNICVQWGRRFQPPESELEQLLLPYREWSSSMQNYFFDLSIGPPILCDPIRERQICRIVETLASEIQELRRGLRISEWRTDPSFDESLPSAKTNKKDGATIVFDHDVSDGDMDDGMTGSTAGTSVQSMGESLAESLGESMEEDLYSIFDGTDISMSSSDAEDSDFACSDDEMDATDEDSV